MYVHVHVLIQRERDNLRKLLSKRDAHVEGHRGTGQGGLISVADLQLAEENQELKDKLAQAEAQVHVRNIPLVHQ
jgi:hypothetical protein